MNDVNKMHPRQLVRGLMRGERASFKAGYTATSAAMAVQSLKKLDDRAYEEIHVYAQGYAEGMAQTMGKPVGMPPDFEDSTLADLFFEGTQDGKAEDPGEINPTKKAV